MATIVYLDAEDEITSAASRIRSARDDRVGLVLPFGSRVATSRINFRLLAREAMANGRRLDIVAPDASARALAASAGLPVFGSVGEYEAALDADEDARRSEPARRRARPTGAAAGPPRAPSGAAAVAAGRAGPVRRRGRPRPRREPRGPRRRRAPGSGRLDHRTGARRRGAPGAAPVPRPRAHGSS